MADKNFREAEVNTHHLGLSTACKQTLPCIGERFVGASLCDDPPYSVQGRASASRSSVHGRRLCRVTAKTAGSEGATGVESDLPVDHVSDVTAFDEELHHFLAFPGHLCPSGFCFWILFEPPNLLPVEDEINLAQLAFRSAPDGISLSP
jgi:hypothetical protein